MINYDQTYAKSMSEGSLGSVTALKKPLFLNLKTMVKYSDEVLVLRRKKIVMWNSNFGWK